MARNDTPAAPPIDEPVHGVTYDGSLENPLQVKSADKFDVDETVPYFSDRRRRVNFWGMVVRLSVVAGLGLYLAIDALVLSYEPVPSISYLMAGYVVLNVAVWFSLSRGSRILSWVFAGIDVAGIVGALVLLPAAALPDPVFSLVALFALLLMFNASYGNPSLNASLSLGALFITTGVLFAPLSFLEHWPPAENPAVHGFLMLQYMSIACLVTCILSIYLRNQTEAYTNEIIRRKRSAVQVATERARRQEAERLDDLKKDFIQVLSHELRSPMTPLRSSLEMVRSQMDKGVLDSEMLDVSIQAAASLEELVNDYTQLARLLTENESGTTKCNIRLHLLLTDLISELPGEEPDLDRLREINTCANPALLTEALRTLLRRATRQMDEDEELSISGQRTKRDVKLHIRNPSDSFSEAEELLDDPFCPINERVFFSEGTGLELILARHGMKQLGGRLEIQQEKSGTTITCHLPPENEDAPWANAQQLQYFRVGAS